ncbi:MAG: 50S ribosomal protein L22 [Chloroflexi bacterium]|nr:50S ribosomal protein L22 [Chloroflexota bacterium]
MATDVQAKLSNLNTSAQKARLVVDLVRGKPVLEALDILKFTPNKSAEPVRKLIVSAMANGEENYGISREDLYVHQIFADEAQTRKWRRFGARGRFKPILRRRSHITVILREVE